MSAERLREAAALMRERAEAATPGPWEDFVFADGAVFVERVGADESDDGASVVNGGSPTDATHIAAWHPAVALAVADWLDEEARWVDSGNEVIPAALAVANAYLGNPA